MLNNTGFRKGGWGKNSTPILEGHRVCVEIKQTWMLEVLGRSGGLERTDKVVSYNPSKNIDLNNND